MTPACREVDTAALCVGKLRQPLCLLNVGVLRQPLYPTCWGLRVLGEMLLWRMRRIVCHLCVWGGKLPHEGVNLTLRVLLM